LAVGAAGLLLAACGGTKAGANSTTTTAASSSSTTIPSKPTLTTQTTIPYNIPLVQHGTGPASLSQFTVPAKAKEWDLDWEYDCTATPTKKGTFSVKIVGHGSAANTTDAGVPQQSGSGTAGLVKNYDIGTFNLDVATPCKWTVRIEIIT
jgi:hypothetical protein